MPWRTPFEYFKYDNQNDRRTKAKSTSNSLFSKHISRNRTSPSKRTKRLLPYRMTLMLPQYAVIRADNWQCQKSCTLDSLVMDHLNYHLTYKKLPSDPTEKLCKLVTPHTPRHTNCQRIHTIHHQPIYDLHRHNAVFLLPPKDP